MSVVLVFGAALLTQRNLQNVNGGFEDKGVLVFSLDARDTTFPLERMTGLCETLDRLRRQRPAIAAACSTMSPSIPHLKAGSSESRRRQVLAQVACSHRDTEYFDTFGIGLVRGRFLTVRTASSTRVAVINESVAKAFFGDSDPVGKPIGFGSRPIRSCAHSRRRRPRRGTRCARHPEDGLSASRPEP